MLGQETSLPHPPARMLSRSIQNPTIHIRDLLPPVPHHGNAGGVLDVIQRVRGPAPGNPPVCPVARCRVSLSCPMTFALFAVAQTMASIGVKPAWTKSCNSRCSANPATRVGIAPESVPIATRIPASCRVLTFCMARRWAATFRAVVVLARVLATYSGLNHVDNKSGATALVKNGLSIQSGWFA